MSKRTVLSMQHNYHGPPENFAMVVPEPVVLHMPHVQTSSVNKLITPAAYSPFRRHQFGHNDRTSLFDLSIHRIFRSSSIAASAAAIGRMKSNPRLIVMEPGGPPEDLPI